MELSTWELIVECILPLVGMIVVSGMVAWMLLWAHGSTGPCEQDEPENWIDHLHHERPRIEQLLEDHLPGTPEHRLGESLMDILANTEPNTSPESGNGDR